MKVLHVYPSLDATLGGPSSVAPELAKALVANGVEVHIVTTDYFAEGERTPREVEIDGYKTFYLRRTGTGSFVYSGELKAWLQTHIRDYDLIHIHTVFAYPTYAASRIAQRASTPYIITPHGMLEPWCLAYKSWKKQPYMKLVERRTLQRAAAIHALAKAEQRNIRQLGIETEIFVVANGMNPDEFEDLPSRKVFETAFPETKNKRLLLFLSRLDPKKGVDILLHAYAELLAEPDIGDLHLVIAGPDLVNYKIQLEEIVKQRGITSAVTFTGMLTGEMKLAALASADVFALPSHSEGFSMAILEAMAAGCPVVITEACNFPEVAEFNAGFVIQPDETQLIGKLKRLLSDENLRCAMAGRARALVGEFYGWNKIARQLIERYREVLVGQSDVVSRAAREQLSETV